MQFLLSTLFLNLNSLKGKVLKKTIFWLEASKTIIPGFRFITWLLNVTLVMEPSSFMAKQKYKILSQIIDIMSQNHKN